MSRPPRCVPVVEDGRVLAYVHTARPLTDDDLAAVERFRQILTDAHTKESTLTTKKPTQVPAPKPVDLDDIAEWVDADRKLTAQITAAEARVDALRSELGIGGLIEARDKIRERIQERIGDAHEARIGGRPVITWRPQKATTYFDSKTFRAELPDVWERFQKPKKAPRPYVLLNVEDGQA